MYIGEKPRKGLSKFVAVLTALAIASASLLAVPAYAAESGAENQNPVIEFFGNIAGNELKAEYLLPIFIDELLKAGKVTVKVLPTHDRWFGVTYQEDKPVVIESFAKLIEAGVYRKDLFSDLKK